MSIKACTRCSKPFGPLEQAKVIGSAQATLGGEVTPIHVVIVDALCVDCSRRENER